jgi:hypothetical protein
MTRSLSELRAARDRVGARADRAFTRVVNGEVKSSAYAQRLANQLERAEGDYERACYAANVEPESRS